MIQRPHIVRIPGSNNSRTSLCTAGILCLLSSLLWYVLILYKYICIYVYVCIYIYIHSIYISLSLSLSLSLPIYIYIYTYICILNDIHICRHMYVHTPLSPRKTRLGSSRNPRCPDSCRAKNRLVLANVEFNALNSIHWTNIQWKLNLRTMNRKHVNSNERPKSPKSSQSLYESYNPRCPDSCRANWDVERKKWLSIVHT